MKNLNYLTSLNFIKTVGAKWAPRFSASFNKNYIMNDCKELSGGSEGTRTLGLLRDRQTL